MPKHYNTEITERAQDLFEFKALDSLEPEVMPAIYPTVPILISDSDRILSAVVTGGGDQTLFALPAGRNFFVTSLTYSFHSEAGCDDTTHLVNGTLDGNSVTIFRITKNASVLRVETHPISFPFPIKLDAGTNLVSNVVFAAGQCTRAVTVTGYIR